MSGSWGVWSCVALAGLCGCGLDVSFEPENRAIIEGYEPDMGGVVDVGGAADQGEEEEGAPLVGFGHAAWGAVLRSHLRGACLDYEGLGASEGSLALLGQYVDQLSRADLEGLGGAEERAAFWVNAYNALTVWGVVGARAEDPGFQVDRGGFVFFQERRWEVGGLRVSLDLIEHGVLRGDAGHGSVSGLEDEGVRAAVMAEHGRIGDFDARIHFALNCASRSCPDLRGEPYQGEGWEEALSAQTVAFLSDEGKGAGPEGVSMLFLWFFSDFARDGGDVEGFIGRWREGGVEGVALGRYLPYSWAPNALVEGDPACE